MDRLEESFRRYSARPALRWKQKEWSYADLEHASLAAASMLRTRGLRPGDRVALWYRNKPALAIWLLACWRSGLVAAPVDSRYRAAEATAMLWSYRPAALIGEPHLLRRLPSLVIEEAGLERYSPSQAWRPAAAAQAPRPDENGWPVEGERTPALIVHTSGTTRMPKEVTHSHGSLLYNACVQVSAQQLDADDVVLLSTALTRTAAITSLLNTLCSGATAVLVPAAEPAAVLAAVAGHRVTRLLLLAAHLRAVVLHPEFRTVDFSTVRTCLAGGDRVPLEAHTGFFEHTGLEVTELCAMTECSHFLSNAPFGPKRVGSVGVPLPGVDVRLEAEPSHPAPDGGYGEILVRSKGLMLGYWNNRGATAEALRDDWLHTGDLAVKDDCGYFWFVGRKKAIIVRDGSNISPEEVRFELVKHPAVQDALVVGERDPAAGEVPVAWVRVRRAAAAPSAQELRRFLEARLAHYKVPARIHFVD
jgi:long-chain acyl-CoA synthetase